MARPEQVAKLLDFDFPKPTSREGPGAGGGLDSKKEKCKMETNHAKGERAVTFESLVNETLNVLAGPDGCEGPADVLATAAADLQRSLEAMTYGFANVFSELDSHCGTGCDETLAFEDACHVAIGRLVNGYLTDVLRTLRRTVRTVCVDDDPLCLRQVEKGGLE